MRIALTGATGLVGRFIAERALRDGSTVVSLSRTPPLAGFFSAPIGHVRFDLDEPAPDLRGFDVLIHCAFAHVPGRYRGGEGDDPQGFLARNVEGTRRIFAAARKAGARIVFLSSRAVYGPHDGPVDETTPCRPDTLYGQAKLVAEQELRGLHGMATILRATGVYGPPGRGQAHKWTGLFANFAEGRPIAPRVGTEVHGDDLAAAVRLGLSGAGGIYNVSDLMLDRRDLLDEWSRVSGVRGPLPPRADAAGFAEMRCDRLRDLGWSPGGMAMLRETLGEIAKAP